MGIFWGTFKNIEDPEEEQQYKMALQSGVGHPKRPPSFCIVALLPATPRPEPLLSNSRIALLKQIFIIIIEASPKESQISPISSQSLNGASRRAREVSKKKENQN